GRVWKETPRAVRGMDVGRGSGRRRIGDTWYPLITFCDRCQLLLGRRQIGDEPELAEDGRRVEVDALADEDNLTRSPGSSPTCAAIRVRTHRPTSSPDARGRRRPDFRGGIVCQMP